MKNGRARKKFLNKLPKNGIVAEVGVAGGDHAAAMKEISNPKGMYLIDPWIVCFGPGEGAMKQVEDSLSVNILDEGVFNLEVHTDSIVAMKEYSVNASKYFPDEFFDYVYIDADHRYDGVKEDIVHWFPKVKKGGYISGHDYRHTRQRMYGIKRAVTELLDEHDLELAFTSRGFDWAVLKK